MKQCPRTYARIDIDAILHNVNEVKKRIKKETMIMAVIKADGYGHGSVTLADYLSDLVDYFGVALIEEAVELRNNGITKPILILGYTDPTQFDLVVDYDVTQTIFTKESAALLSEIAVKNNKIAKLHIAVDTGMTRIGFEDTSDSVNEIKEICTYKNLNVEGIFTHFACADQKDKTSAKIQFSRYMNFINLLSKNGIDIPIKHVSNSAAIIEFNDTNLNMVRSGIITYGLYPSDEVETEPIKAIPAMSLITHVVHVKTVPSGCGVSYGHTYITDKPTKIATLPVGYADGYPRALSSKGRVIIGGQYAPIIGRVCMDQMMVDVSDIDKRW